MKTQGLGTVVIAGNQSLLFFLINCFKYKFILGDIFERKEDIDNPEMWISEGGSINPKRQTQSRSEILKIADYIVPGHGPMFKVTDEMRNKVVYS